MSRTPTVNEKHVRSRVRDIAAVGWQRRRACVTCGARYWPVQGVHPDPRCRRCAAQLASTGDREAELGGGD